MPELTRLYCGRCNGGEMQRPEFVNPIYEDKLAMKTTLVPVFLIVLVGCVSSEVPGPDPTSTSSSGTGGTSSTTSSANVSASSGSTGSSSTGSNMQADGFVSGSRLQAQYWAGADGSKQFYGWYDTALKATCGIGGIEPGEFYCLPYGPPIKNPSEHFADAGCLTPALQYPQAALMCGPTPQFASQPGAYIPGAPGTCASATAAAVFRVGAKLMDYYEGSPGNCAKGTPSMDLEFFSLVSMPSSEFVKMTRM